MGRVSLSLPLPAIGPGAGAVVTPELGLSVRNPDRHFGTFATFVIFKKQSAMDGNQHRIPCRTYSE